MLNPLVAKGSSNAKKSLMREQKKETENDIYCVLCGKNYEIEQYKIHRLQHKR
jgi:hypothetical protein